jgi:hypothetical protein
MNQSLDLSSLIWSIIWEYWCGWGVDYVINCNAFLQSNLTLTFSISSISQATHYPCKIAWSSTYKLSAKSTGPLNPLIQIPLSYWIRPPQPATPRLPYELASTYKTYCYGSGKGQQCNCNMKIKQILITI